MICGGNITRIRPMIKAVKDLGNIDLIGVEIGVLEGMNAVNMLQVLPIKKLYLIDPYKVYDEYIDIKSPGFHVIKKRAERRLKPFKDKIVWLIKKSIDAVMFIPSDLDFVYIDGNHSYKSCLEDITNYYPKIKKGGVIGGHDYYNKGEAREVKKAVDEFASKKKLIINSVVGCGRCDWWIIK